jgi:hypothetical protein
MRYSFQAGLAWMHWFTAKSLLEPQLYFGQVVALSVFMARAAEAPKIRLHIY